MDEKWKNQATAYPNFGLVPIRVGNVEQNSIEVSNNNVDRLGFISAQFIKWNQITYRGV